MTDLHFGKQAEEIFRDKRELAKSIVRAIEPEVRAATSKVLVVSGDLIHKGNESVNAYPEAQLFIDNVRREWAVGANATIVCPGNHDIVHGLPDPFKPINDVIFALTKSSKLLFKGQTSICLRTPEADFLVINTACRRRHEYGWAELSSLPTFPSPSKPRVAVLHHNLFGVLEKDSSAVRNAYPLMVRLLHDKVRLVLHGHQHIREEFPIGQPRCRIVGAGSLNFKNDDGTPNQFNLITLTEAGTNVFRHIWRPDLPSRGSLGAWQATPD